MRGSRRTIYAHKARFLAASAASTTKCLATIAIHRRKLLHSFMYLKHIKACMGERNLWVPFRERVGTACEYLTTRQRSSRLSRAAQSAGPPRLALSLHRMGSNSNSTVATFGEIDVDQM